VESLAAEAVGRLRRAGVEFQPGLSQHELARIEAHFGFGFSPDHRELLSLALPVGHRWVDWREGSHSELADRLTSPTDGVVFDVHNNGFWPGSWGTRPWDAQSAEAVARERMAEVPMLVPIYGHRYMPAAPAPSASPVLSVMQTDIIYYGDDLLDYIANEFHLPPRHPAINADPPRIRFWSDLVLGTESEDF
jgi:hypothetical protein